MTADLDVVTAVAETADGILGGEGRTESTVDAGWAGSAWHKLAASGLVRLGVPEQHGGSGGGVAEAAAVIRAAAAHAASMPIVESTLLAGWLAGCGPFAVPDGVLTVGVAGEPVPWGSVAEQVLVADTTTLRLVPAAVARWSAERNLAGEPRDQATIPEQAGDVVAALTGDAVTRLRLLSALGRSVQIAGAAEAVLDLSVTYVRERVQFGKPLARQQAVQQMLARLAGETVAAGAAADAAVSAVERHGIGSLRGEFAVAAAKTRCGEAAGAVARLAHQLHGAIGLTEEYALGAFTMRLWSWREEAGTAGFWADWLGRRAVRLGPDALWDLIAEGG
ncbi:MAG TPA: acyl-CoA dehydrogenase family protein [Amycolatopsis sp.]|nr:acyl-CoA dehydrogenase family protein [Amycolatopsis sp.]